MADQNLKRQLERMKSLVAKEEHYLIQKEKSLKERENRLKQLVLKDTQPQNLKANIKAHLPNYLAPGNVGDINRVIWPFYFTTDKVEVQPNSNQRTSFVVTLEASFVWMYYTKTVFVKDAVSGEESYLDPDDTSSFASGLSFFMRDPQSQREFFNRPIRMEHVGNPRWPSTLPAPQMILPRSTIEVNFINETDDTIYIPQITFFGYRIRMEHQQELLSTVY